MVILHITDILNASGNGVAFAVRDFVKFESQENNVAIFSLNSLIESKEVEEFSYSNFKNISDLPEKFKNPDIVIFNEVYKPKYIKLYKECIKRNIPYVIIPHGCLVKKSQANKKIKKIIGNLLIFNKFIKKASAVQFLNNQEKENSIFKYKKAIISGNGINPKEVSKNNAKNTKIIYIGRYSFYIKGMDLLLEVCTKNKKWFLDNNIKIELYGRDSVNSLEKINKIIKDNNLEDIIIINGPVFGSEKKKVLEEAYCFIQLSRHEGQPMGIIEALAYGVPCIVTYGTSFGEYVNENNCGFGCNFNSYEVFEAIKKIYNKSVRSKQSKNAKINAIKDFDWNIIINNLMKEYKVIVDDF